MKIKVGRLIESFCILPSLNINWINTLNSNRNKFVFDIQFAWFLWYISTNNISTELEKWNIDIDCNKHLREDFDD